MKYENHTETKKNYIISYKFNKFIDNELVNIVMDINYKYLLKKIKHIIVKYHI